MQLLDKHLLRIIYPDSCATYYRAVSRELFYNKAILQRDTPSVSHLVYLSKHSL